MTYLVFYSAAAGAFCIISQQVRASFCPNAQTCRCALEPYRRLRAGLPVPGTGSMYLGPNARMNRCATETSCQSLAGLALTGTEPAYFVINTRVIDAQPNPLVAY